MMIGVAQVIGTKPMLSFFFSNGPSDSFTAALTESIGIIDPRIAAIVPPPTIPMNERRLISLWPNMPRTIALSIARSSTSSELAKLSLEVYFISNA